MDIRNKFGFEDMTLLPGIENDDPVNQELRKLRNEHLLTPDMDGSNKKTSGEAGDNTIAEATDKDGN